MFLIILGFVNTMDFRDVDLWALLPTHPRSSPIIPDHPKHTYTHTHTYIHVTHIYIYMYIYIYIYICMQYMWRPPAKLQWCTFGATSIQSKKHLETSLAPIQTLHGWLTSNLTLIQRLWISIAKYPNSKELGAIVTQKWYGIVHFQDWRSEQSELLQQLWSTKHLKKKIVTPIGKVIYIYISWLAS